MGRMESFNLARKSEQNMSPEKKPSSSCRESRGWRHDWQKKGIGLMQLTLMAIKLETTQGARRGTPKMKCDLIPKDSPICPNEPRCNRHLMMMVLLRVGLYHCWLPVAPQSPPSCSLIIAPRLSRSCYTKTRCRGVTRPAYNLHNAEVGTVMSITKRD